MPEQTADHDILIEIKTTLNLYVKIINDIKVDVDRRFTELWIATDKNTQEIQRARGFLSGSKFVWLCIGALPPSLVAAFVGIHQ